MNSKEYIICQLEKFVKDFKNVKVRYEFDPYSYIHIIEVVPNNVYHLDNDYIKWENQLFGSFVEEYPAENIGFISDDSYIEIENPIFVKAGECYFINNVISDKNESRNIALPEGFLPSYRKTDHINISVCKPDCNYDWGMVSRKAELFGINDLYLNAA